MDVAHLEPILGYTVRHEDNEHLHLAHAMGALSAEDHATHSNNAARSLGAHSTHARSQNGLHQPFPSHIPSIVFHAWGRQVTVPPLHLLHELFGVHTETQVVDPATNSTRTIPNVLQSYHGFDASLGLQASVTLRDDGVFHGLLQWYDAASGQLVETMQIDPVQAHASFVEPHVYDALQEAAEHAMVAFLHSELNEKTQLQDCGSVKPPDSDSDAGEFDVDSSQVRKEPLRGGGASSFPKGSSGRRRELLATIPNIPIGQGVTRWTNCYPGDTATHKMSIGSAADAGFYGVYNDVAKTQAALASVSETNTSHHATSFRMRAHPLIRIRISSHCCLFFLVPRCVLLVLRECEFGLHC